jgi:hypothetical protein|tara:strand:+ start:68 stop:367 length:300 start_codon:yes stop_codon:yes gene_type:complete
MSGLNNPAIIVFSTLLCTPNPWFNLVKSISQAEATKDTDSYAPNTIFNSIVTLIFFIIMFYAFVKYIFKDDNRNSFCEGFIACLSPVVYIAFKQAGKSV